MDKRGLIILSFILILSFLLRLHDYTVIPYPFENWDEWEYGWSGWSLLHRGEPVGWSKDLETYSSRNTSVSFQGRMFNLVVPYLDHPPLFSIITGLFAELGSPESLFEVSLAYIRLTPIMFSLFTVLLIFLIGRIVFSEGVGLAAAIAYTAIPTTVVSNRLVVAENMLTPMILASVYLTLLYIRNNDPRMPWIIGLTGGLAILVKEAGIIIPSAAVLMLFLSGKKRGTYPIFFLALVGLLLYLAYGWVYDWDLFYQIRMGFSDNPHGIETFLKLLFQPKIILRGFYDGWILYGWIALAYVLIAVKPRQVFTPCIAYIIFTILTVNKDFVWGHYYYPIYPFLCLAIGKTIFDIVQEKKTMIFTIALLVGGLWTTTNIEVFLGLSLNNSNATTIFLGVTQLFKILALLSIIPYALTDNPKVRKYIALNIFTILLLLNIIIIIQFGVIYPRTSYLWETFILEKLIIR